MAKTIIHICLLILLVGNANAFSNQQSQQDEALNEAIVKFINVFLAKNKLSQTFAISRNDKVISRKTTGYADVKSRRSLTTNDIFPLMLASSHFTATAILRMQDKNLLDVNDHIDKHLTKNIGIWPNNKIPSWASKVTIQDLLTHSSGIADYSNQITFNNTEKLSTSLKSVAAFAASKELLFTPGSKVSRSTTNYLLLGLIIEAKSGKSLAKFLETEFFEPLGMRSTKLTSKFELLGLLTGNMEDKYPKNYIAQENPQPIDNKYSVKFLEPTSRLSEAFLAYGDMGIISNSKDLSTWVNALHHGKILSEGSYKKMIRPYFKISYDKEFGETYLGYGIYISKVENGLVYLHNNSSIGGFDINFGYLPGYDLNINVLSNIRPTSETSTDHTRSYMYQYRYVNARDMMLKLFDVISNTMPGCFNKHCMEKKKS